MTSRLPRLGVAVWLAIGWLAVVVLAAMFADVLPLRDYSVSVPGVPSRLTPRWSLHEPLGTDSIGRSVLSRLVYGGRQSLTVGVVVVVLAMSIGATLGIIAAYFGGTVDRAIAVVVDAALSIPPLVLLLAVASIGKRDLTTVIVGLGIVVTPYFARIARANTLGQVGREYVQAARSMGAGHLRIIAKELLPNVIFPMLTFAFLVLGLVLVAEGSLSFLGLGIPPPQPSWGGMVSAGRSTLADDPQLVLIPSFCLICTVTSATVIGDHLRRAYAGVRSQ